MRLSLYPCFGTALGSWRCEGGGEIEDGGDDLIGSRVLAEHDGPEHQQPEAEVGQGVQVRVVCSDDAAEVSSGAFAYTRSSD
jgi:hypothetical protein